MQGIPEYNAFERDIAVLNVFFGDSTVLGTFGRGEVKHVFLPCTGGGGGRGECQATQKAAVGAIKGPGWQNQNDDDEHTNDFYMRPTVKFISNE